MRHAVPGSEEGLDRLHVSGRPEEQSVGEAVVGGLRPQPDRELQRRELERRVGLQLVRRAYGPTAAEAPLARRPARRRAGTACRTGSGGGRDRAGVPVVTGGSGQGRGPRRRTKDDRPSATRRHSAALVRRYYSCPLPVQLPARAPPPPDRPTDTQVGATWASRTGTCGARGRPSTAIDHDERPVPNASGGGRPRRRPPPRARRPQ
jgi:hypothetical protein